jgi:hypothetical protein
VLVFGNYIDASIIMYGEHEEKLEVMGVYGRIILNGFSGSVMLVMDGLTFRRKCLLGGGHL